MTEQIQMQKHDYLYQQIVELSRDGIWVVDERGITTFVNPSMSTMLGYSEEEFIGRNMFDFMREDSTSIFGTDDLQLIHKDGSIVTVSINFSPILTETSDLYSGLILNLRDITERRKQEEVLYRSETQLRNAQKIAKLGSFEFNLQSQIAQCSDQVYDIFEITPQPEITFREFDRFTHPEDSPRINAIVVNAIKKQDFYSLEYRIISASGTEKSLYAVGQPIVNDEGAVTHILGTIQDISERVNSQKQLNYYNSLVENIPNAIISTDANFVIQGWNSAAQELYGWYAEEAIGTASNQLFKTVILESTREEAIAELYTTGKWVGESIHTRKDGSTFYAHASITLVKDKEGEILGIIGINRDITEQHEAQEALLEAHHTLEQRVQERTAALKIANEDIRNFVYIVSHDLRAPLINIKGFSAELASALEIFQTSIAPLVEYLAPEQQEILQYASDEDIPEALNFINTSVSTIEKLINAVLKLSRLGRRDLYFESIDMNTMIENVVKSLEHKTREIDATIDYEKLPTIIADSLSIEQIFTNLINNALNYHDPNRKQSIEITYEVESDLTRFYVKDTGCGIAEADSSKIFDLFKRVNPRNIEGEGMGLTYVQTLIRRHDGQIDVKSELGVGSTFSFTIANRLGEN